MSAGDYILDTSFEEHAKRAHEIGWKEALYTCNALDAEMVDDHPYWSRLSDEDKLKYNKVYEIYWNYVVNNAPKRKK